MSEVDRTKSMLVSDLLTHHAAASPERMFLICGDAELTYAQTEERSWKIAGGLHELGVAPEDRVTILLPNQVEYVLTIFACARVGAVQVPINTYLRGEFLLHQLRESQSGTVVTDLLGFQQIEPLLPELPDLRRIVIVGAELPQTTAVEVTSYTNLEVADRLAEAAPLTPDGLSTIMYTSGTTGPSKGCMLSHGYYARIPRGFCDADHFIERDTIIGATPLFHASCQLWVVMCALTVGGTAVVEPEFHATTFMQRVRDTKTTVIVGMPAMTMAVLAQPERADERGNHLRHALWSHTSPIVQKRFEDRFGVPVIADVYGQTECFPATISSPGDARRPGSAGRVLPNIELALVDDDDVKVPVGEVGEIVIRPSEPHSIFQGYWNNPEATLQIFRNLWHHTGDLGRFDEDGYLYFVDRKKDSMRRRGENVSSIELEHAIAKHPAIAQVAVHAVPSEFSGDEIKACIVLRPGAVLDAEHLFEFFRTKLPYFAIPRYVELMDELPLNNLRVQKFRLRERGITGSTWDFEALGFVVERHERRAAMQSVPAE